MVCLSDWTCHSLWQSLCPGSGTTSTCDEEAVHLVAEVAPHLHHGIVRLLCKVPGGLQNQCQGPLLAACIACGWL